MKKPIFIILALLFSVDTVNSHQLQQDNGSEAAHIEGLVQRLISADNDGDIEAVLSAYAKDAILISPSGEDIVGIQAIEGHYRRLFRNFALEIYHYPEETIIKGDWALSRGINCIISTARSGGPQSYVHSKYLLIAGKTSGQSWKITHLIWNNQPAESCS